jgi:hypothetical protein
VAADTPGIQSRREPSPEEPRPVPPPRGAPSALGEVARRGARWLRRQLHEPERPLVAVEVRPRSVGVVRLAREGGRFVLGAAAAMDLPPGCLDLSIVQGNVADCDGLQRTLRATLERCGVLEGARVALVLPDPVARVALLPAADVTGRGRAQTEELIRFRLRKSVPFDIREARLAFTADGARATDSVTVAAIHRPVLDSYEAACRAVSLEPGLVELSGLALLGATFGSRPPEDRLLVNWDDGYVTILIARGEWPLLVRTLTGEPAAQPDQVAREVANTVLYYRDRLGGPGLAEAAVRSAALPHERAAAILEEPLGMAPVPVEPWRSLSLGVPAPMSQALAGAAASLTAGRG